MIFSKIRSHMNKAIYSPGQANRKVDKVWLSLFCLILFLSQPAHAKQIPNFKASFTVEAFGMNLGQAKQTFSCKDQKCTLTSFAKPQGLAAIFSTDSSKETIKLTQTDSALTWLSYHKLGKAEKEGNVVEKHRSIKRNPQANEITSYKNKRLKNTWAAPEHVYDAVSLAYGIQFAAINQQPIKNFYLQDVSFQDKLSLISQEKNQNLTLPFKNNPLKAVKYHFTSEHAKITLWLLPTYQYFPSKIQIVNHNDKTITLFLAEPPKFYETQR